MAGTRAADEGWEQHRHEAVVHAHGHFHVTHNDDGSGGFEHLSSWHEHEHDHAELDHTHFPHQDFESEHAGEAHDHDHRTPVLDRPAAAKATKVRKATKKTASPAGAGDSATA